MMHRRISTKGRFTSSTGFVLE